MQRPEPMTTTVSTKGQVILPKAIRQRRDWHTGTRLVVEETAEGILLRRAPTFSPAVPKAVFAMLLPKGAPKSVEDMDAAVLAEARRRHAGD
jgi:AbrB family looped-hinge helix DNA binding protein